MYGSWGVCFTHGTWFGVKGLLAAGKTYRTSSSIRRASDFLPSKHGNRWEGSEGSNLGHGEAGQVSCYHSMYYRGAVGALVVAIEHEFGV
ncbi:hypothetical protein Syun_011759 [Stephania yunnanensis]|uniref:Uncharacterized protein n=1 Tax=Stephania yunnanensis TaxID=152371 RepID=A0AAP0PGU0_9MAGN